MRIIQRYKPVVLKEYRGDQSFINRQLYKNLLENSAISYLQQMGSMFDQGSFDGQKDYWNWQAKASKSVRCISYKKIPVLRELVDEFLEGNEIKKNECYYNSIKVVWNIPGVEYIEGIADLIIPLDHAWNYYKGYYFDLTAEIVLNKDVSKYDYAQVIKLDRRKMDKYVYKTKVAGGYISNYYGDEIKK